MITFAVVTITFNAAHCLRRTLDSVLTQSYPHVHHYIIDGNSTDDTVEMAQTYQQVSDALPNGHQVMVVSEPDNGLYDAMNKGLLKATGDYVLFLNAGDYFPHPDTLAHVAAKVKALSVEKDRWPAVLYGSTRIVDADGNDLGPRHLSVPDKLTWRSFRHGMLVCHQAFYARLDIAQGTPYQLCYRFSADVDWCIRVMKEAEQMQLTLLPLNEEVVNYLDEGETTRHHRASLKERFSVMVSHYGLFSTVIMHLWFVVRAVLKKYSSSCSTQIAH